MNKIFLIGNLTRDPEVLTTEKGLAIAKFSVAINRFYRNKEGERVEECNFFDVEFFARQAELCQQYLQKGKKVAIEGRLRQNRWQNKEGQWRNKILVVGERVEFLSPRQNQPAVLQGDQDELPF